MWKLEPSPGMVVMHYVPGEFSGRKCIGVDQHSAARRSRTDYVLVVKHPNYRYCNPSKNAKPLETPCINHLRPFPHLFADEYSLWSVAITVGTPTTRRPPHRTEWGLLRHSAPTSGV